MKTSLWITALLGLSMLTFLGGYGLREVQTSSETGFPQENRGQGQVERSREVRPRWKAEVNESLPRAEFWVRWITRFENAPLDHFLDLSEEIGHEQKLLHMLALAWVKRDRDHFLRTLIAHEKHSNFISRRKLRLEDLFDCFSEIVVEPNPESALQMIAGMEKSKYVDQIRFRVLWERSKTDLPGAIALATEWELDRVNFRPDLIKAEALKNPTELIDLFLSYREMKGLQAQSQVDRCLQIIVVEMMKANPVERMDFALTQSGALQNLTFENWVRSDFETASEWLGEQEDLEVKQEQDFRIKLLNQWAREDAPAAIAWAEEHFEKDALILAGSTMLAAAIKEDPQKGISAFQSIQSSETRLGLVADFAARLFKEDDRNDGERIKPLAEEAVAWIKSLDDPDLLNEALRQTQGTWSTKDAKGFEEFLSSEKGRELPASSFMALANEKAFSDPEGATVWANEFEGEKRSKIAARVFDTWIDQSPEQAVDWFVKVPVDDPRHRLLTEELITGLRSLANPQPLLDRLSPEQRSIVEHGSPLFGLAETFEEQLRQSRKK